MNKQTPLLILCAVFLASCGSGLTSSVATSSAASSSAPTASKAATSSPDMTSSKTVSTTSEQTSDSPASTAESSTPTESSSPTESSTVPDTETDLALYFTGPSDYVMSHNEDGSTGVSYTSIASNTYHNVTAKLNYTFAGVTALGLSLTNTGTSDIALRADILDPAFTNEKNSHCINTEASASGDLVYTKTDLTWGGSYFTLPAGKSGAMKIAFMNAQTPTSFLLMLDSFGGSATDLRSGALTLSAYKAYNGTATPIAVATSYDLTVSHWSLNSSKFTRTYTATETEFVYTSIARNGYRYTGILEAAALGDLSAYNAVTFTFTNKGDHDVGFRVDLNAAKGDGVLLNVSSSSPTGQTTLDADKAGSTITIPAAISGKITVVWAGTLGFVGVMADNSIYGDTSTVSGDVVFSNTLTFTKVA